jgi:hypothetical protein
MIIASKLQGVNLRLNEVKCSNCGEDCLGDPLQRESQTIVPIHYFFEKQQVCCDCYQILRELDCPG